MHCSHCDIEILEQPFVVEGEIFCCERCYGAAQRLKSAHIEREKNTLDLIGALIRALDSRELNTANHSQRVARYSHFLARLMGVPADECLHICRGALLHDIGKIGIPDNILLKPDKLTPGEWQVMQQHPTIGRDILAGIDDMTQAAELVYSHHEHYDGGGYPRGLASEAIPLGARIFMVADAVDAITNDRPYHKGASLNVAIEHLQDQSGRTFDPAVVNALVEHQNAFAALMVKLTSQASISFDESALVSDIQTRPLHEK